MMFQLQKLNIGSRRGKMVMKGESTRIPSHCIYLNVKYWHSAGETEENHENMSWNQSKIHTKNTALCPYTYSQLDSNITVMGCGGHPTTDTIT